MIQERKPMAPVVFIFCGEQGALIPVNNWGEKNVFMANGWMLKKESAHGWTRESPLAEQEQLFFGCDLPW